MYFFLFNHSTKVVFLSGKFYFQSVLDLKFKKLLLYEFKNHSKSDNNKIAKVIRDVFCSDDFLKPELHLQSKQLRFFYEFYQQDKPILY
jgi:hypothetical protein